MREQAFDLVKKSIEQLNEELNYDSLKNVSEATPIFGGDDGIDSLSLVSLIVNLESDVEKKFGKKVLLSDEKAMSMRNSPYRSVGALVNLIVARLEDSHV